MVKTLLCTVLCGALIGSAQAQRVSEDVLRDRPYAEKQRKPDDMEAQEGQRRIAIHALENRGYSDIGVTLLRRILRESVRAVKNFETSWNTVMTPEQFEEMKHHVPARPGDAARAALEPAS